jgi:hypothetical protein
MFRNIFKAKKRAQEPTAQHIAFPLEEFDALNPAEKRENHDRLSRDGWEFTIRAFNWMIMSRVSAAAVPSHLDGLYGVKNARLFSEAELTSLLFRLQARIRAQRSVRFEDRELVLEKTFQDFANSKGLDKEKQQKILHMMRFRASRGEVVGYEDLKRYPFTMFGDVKKIFGTNTDDVVSFQNRAARLD